MEMVVPMLFSFWMCVIYIVFAIFMIAVWVGIGIMGGPSMRFKIPKVPPVPKFPSFEEWHKERVTAMDNLKLKEL